MKKSIVLLAACLLFTACGASEGTPVAETVPSETETTTTFIETVITTTSAPSAYDVLEELSLSTMYPNIYYQIYKELKTTSISKERIEEIIMPYSDRYTISDEWTGYIITDEAEPNDKIELWFKHLDEYDIDVLSSMNYHHISELYVMYVQDEPTGKTYTVINSVAGKFTYDNYEDCERMLLNRDFDEVPHEIVE